MVSNRDSESRVDFRVKKAALTEHELVKSPAPTGSLGPGQVVLEVDRFAFTANNISYAVAGDMLDYWGFFPAEDGWGRIPAMAYADVIASTCDAVALGERFFGFFPMATHHVVEARATGEGFIDASDHRESHAAVYRQFSRTTTDPLYDEEFEDETLLLRGLFMTSFLVDDFLADNEHYGAETLLISSASSKTSIALAACAAERGHDRVVGLTSPGNAAFVASLGFYDEVLLYSDLTSLPVDEPAVFVDMAGNAEVRNTLHRHLRDSLKYDCSVGLTHWDKGGPNADLPGPAPEFFFAPAQIAKRSKEWGPAKLRKDLGASWQRFRDGSSKWLEVERGCGEDAVVRVYEATLSGSASPGVGNVLSLWDR